MFVGFVGFETSIKSHQSFAIWATITNLFTTGHLWNTKSKASRHQCNMSAELRKSAGSDIKRLQEMVKRLEEQNAQLKNTDNRRTPNKGEDNMVKVKLNLDDVPLLDLNAMVEEDEDTWLVNRKVIWSRPAVYISVLERHFISLRLRTRTELTCSYNISSL